MAAAVKNQGKKLTDTLKEKYFNEFKAKGTEDPAGKANELVDAYKNTECLVYKGFKIESDSKHKIHIYKPKGEVYKELRKDEYDEICKHGWRKGVLILVLDSYHHKLSKISDNIRDEVNTRRNDKHLKSLKI